jgi:hypothetical protein
MRVALRAGSGKGTFLVAQRAAAKNRKPALWTPAAGALTVHGLGV